MLENGGYTYIAMTIVVSKRAFFVNNGLDQLNRHVSYGKPEWSDDFHFSCPRNSITTTRDGVFCGNFVNSLAMTIVVRSVEIAGIIVRVPGVEEKSEAFAVC